MKYLMKCGHVANAIDKNGKPVCAICAPGVDGVTVESVTDSETGGLEARKARWCSLPKREPRKCGLSTRSASKP